MDGGDDGAVGGGVDGAVDGGVDTEAAGLCCAARSERIASERERTGKYCRICEAEGLFDTSFSSICAQRVPR